MEGMIDMLGAEKKIVVTSGVLRGDMLRGPVKSEKGDLQGLVGEQVRFRFKLWSGSLYSYWFDTN
jgi:hypothetical protein